MLCNKSPTTDTDDKDNLPTRKQWVIKGNRPVEYSVIEAPHLFDSNDINIMTAWSMDPLTSCTKCLVFVDSEIINLHGSRIKRFFSPLEDECRIIPISVTERLKDYAMLEHILQHMVDFGVSRKDELVIVIGGGCIMDIVGLAASLYRRGVPYIRIPTTLLGIVDAAVGVKTGSNFAGNKNRIGSYYPPICALLDTSFLTTLPVRHIKNGMAEILKIAIITDKNLFNTIKTNVDLLITDQLAQTPLSLSVVRCAVQRMLSELEPNLWESNLQRLVDFGHTLSPIFEMKAVDNLLHGEAVAVDICISTMIAANRKLLNPRLALRIIEVTKQIGLPIIHPTCTPSNIAQALSEVVKHRGGLQRIPVPIKIGFATFLNDITVQECMKACEQLHRIAQQHNPV